MAENDAIQDDIEMPANGTSKKLLIGGFISCMVVMETCLFFFMVPSSDEVSALVEARLVKQAQAEGDEPQETDDVNKVVEFPLGTFGETFSPLGTERQYRVEYRVFGTLRQKNHGQMNNEYTEKEGRIRHAIRMVIRNSRLEELQDNQLGLIERRILATCNGVLEEPFLLSVGFDEYQVRED